METKSKKKLIKKKVQPTPEYIPDDWDKEWQPSFEAATIGAKPAPKYKLDEPMTPPRWTADDLQCLEFEASEIVQRQPATPENIARVAEIDAVLQGEALRSARDEAAAQKLRLTLAEIAEIDKAQREINDAQKIINGAEFRIMIIYGNNDCCQICGAFIGSLHAITCDYKNLIVSTDQLTSELPF